MKNKLQLILFIAIGMASLQSCKKDDSPSTGTLKGRWDLTEANIKYYENNVLKGQASENYTKGEAYIVFTDTNFETFTDNQSEDDGSYTYDAATKLLTLTYGPGDSETLQVSTLTANTLIFAIDESETSNGVTTKIVSEVTFKKE